MNVISNSFSLKFHHYSYYHHELHHNHQRKIQPFKPIFNRCDTRAENGKLLFSLSSRLA